MSEPIGKIGKLGSVLSGPIHGNDEDGGETTEFYLSPCFDVLLDFLRFGDRRRLAKLERVGRRFHWIIERRFLTVPFLRLNLQLEPSEELEGGLKAFIGADKAEITLLKLIDVPRFLRFDQVALEYQIGSQSIDQKCDLFSGYLSSIKASLNDSNAIQFDCKIFDGVPNQFRNHSTLLEHIRHIVSICDSSHGYYFGFHFIYMKDYFALGNRIDSYLETPAISRSSLVSFSTYIYPVFTFSALPQLPVEAISNWLNRERNAMDQNQRERCMTLPCNSNLQKICDFLKQKFVKDKLPTVPFTFRACEIYPGQGEVEAQTIMNETTNEQFSVLRQGGFVEVKRSRAPKKKEKTSETVKA